MVVSIYERIESIIVAYIKQFNASPNIHDKTAKADNAFLNLGRGVGKLITAFAIYRIIKQQIESNNYETIDLSTFDHVVKQLVERNPDLKSFMDK